MNRVFVKSRADFKELLKELTEQQFMASAFISIHDPGGDWAPRLEQILVDSDNVLNIWIHDVDEEDDQEKYIHFNNEMANQVIQFIEKNRKAKNWILHCTAGISRSGAIGEFISDYLGQDYFQFKRDNPQINPNSEIKKILNNYVRKD